ncbi:class I SAM-dependent methyltransferase [Vibrio coralliilyticus]|uniref:class I SAM-dependent methyltransferase n=1 Tax=Vibrio coralliilyticus TaxID=190893 RepID=UPI001E450A69|nr:class I SAM-dependent methyltransferase [Vibrio coralliilyticus]MCC2525722.1 methyltransferase domain-containing protein [Vibrio coralliilyticus]
MVAGTKGYEEVIELFAEVSFALHFEEINKDFLSYLPSTPSRVLDAGCGVGQNAAALSELGYDVVGVEPMRQFLDKAILNYKHLDVSWVHDSLPNLASINEDDGLFSFVLVDGVWHHLNNEERRECIRRFSSLMLNGGICAISLRNGPAGAGKCVFPTSCSELINYADELGFKVVFKSENQPSVLPHKESVTWARVALQKIA